MAALTFDLYRFTNPDRSTKDWAVRDNGDGTYTSRWGKTGTRLQSKTFKNMLRINEHVKSKTNKGYRLIGEVLIDDDGKITSASQTSKPQGHDPHPTQDELCIYWRVKIKQTSLADTQAIGAFQLNALSMNRTIQSFLPDHEWIKSFSEKIVKDQLPLSGKLFKEFGVSSLLLFMAMMKVAPDQISIHLSHDDGVEISNQIKLEPKALSFFDTDLGTVRPIAEELGLIEKRIDLSIIASSQDDFYF